MNVTVTISVTDNASPALAAKLAKLDPARMAPIIGPRLNELTRDHLARNGTNKKSWPSTGFWEDAARATNWSQVDVGGILISIAKIGVRQRYHGGPILPKNVRALAIPIHPEAYGKTPKDFNNLILIKTPKGAYLAQGSFEAVGRTAQGKLSRRGKTNVIKRQVLTFLFKLSMGVNQEADPDVIPSKEDYLRRATMALNEAVTKIIKGGGAA